MTIFSPERSLRFRYLLGLGVIALLVTASYMTMQRVISEQRNYARLISLASHQSGLANRIAYFATQMVTTKDDVEFNTARAQIGQAVNKMRSAHRLLREGSLEQGIPKVESDGLALIYDDPVAGLDLAIERFLERARALYEMNPESLGLSSGPYVFLITYGPHAMDPMFEAAVDEYEQIGNQAILSIERLELGIWIAALCTLVLEALIIFRPLERRISETLASLKRTVSELEETRERLVAAQQLAMVGDWQWEEGSDRLSWSRQTYRIFGISPEGFEPTLEGTMRLIHPDDRGACHAAIERARQSHAPVWFECRLIHPDGQERLVYQQVIARRGPDDVRLGLSGVVHDITERKELSRRLEKLSENVPGFLFQYHLLPDGSSHFPYCSPGVQDLFGIRPEQIREDATPAFAAIHHSDVERVLNKLQTSSRDLSIWRDQFRAIHPYQGTVWVEGHATPERLLDGGTRWHGYIWDITDRKRTEDQIRKLALFDPLTGLANRRLLRDRMEHAVVTSRRTCSIGAVLMLDLDNFKSLNDTQGHDAGDSLLIEVGKRLRDNVRDSDTIARLGGDEFVAVLESLGTDLEEARIQASRIAEKIRSALIQPYRISGKDQLHQTSASIGVTLFGVRDMKVDDLLRQADIGMFEAKESGRNRICFFTDARQAAINSRNSMLQALKRALQNDELRLYYQPQISSSGELVGAEALLRWLSPDGDLILPGDFIPLAEETGLILTIGEWVMSRVCQDLTLMARHDLPRDFSVAINISPRQFSDGALSTKIRDVIQSHGVCTGSLKLELTESSLFMDLEHAGTVIEELRGMGIGIELDDFGTGYSSLSALKSLPIDALKLDRTLVQGIIDDGRGRAILRAALAMAKALSLKVIAEGVETRDQHLRLVEEGCDLFQGYLFARPMPLESFVGHLGNRGRSFHPVPDDRDADRRSGSPPVEVMRRSCLLD